MEHKVVIVAEPGPADDPRAQWTPELRRAFEENKASGAVGNLLVSETEDCRVWHLHLPPGGVLQFHRHVLNYFWTVTSASVARGFYEDGRIVDVHHFLGETRHYRFGPGEYMVHMVENVGEADLRFVTVEFLPGNNPAIAIPDRYRAGRQPASVDVPA